MFVPLHPQLNDCTHDDSVAQLVEQLTLNQWVEGSSPSGVTKKTTASFRKPLAAKRLQKLAVFLSWLTPRINSHSFVFPHCISQWRTNNGLGSATVSNQNLNLTSTLMVASVKRLWLMPLNLLNVGSNPHVIRHSPPLHKERLGFRLYPSTSKCFLLFLFIRWHWFVQVYASSPISVYLRGMAWRKRQDIEKFGWKFLFDEGFD